MKHPMYYLRFMWVIYKHGFLSMNGLDWYKENKLDELYEAEIKILKSRYGPAATHDHTSDCIVYSTSQFLQKKGRHAS